MCSLSLGGHRYGLMLSALYPLHVVLSFGCWYLCWGSFMFWFMACLNIETFLVALVNKVNSALFWMIFFVLVHVLLVFISRLQSSINSFGPCMDPSVKFYSIIVCKAQWVLTLWVCFFFWWAWWFIESYFIVLKVVAGLNLWMVFLNQLGGGPFRLFSLHSERPWGDLSTPLVSNVFLAQGLHWGSNTIPRGFILGDIYWGENDIIYWGIYRG